MTIVCVPTGPAVPLAPYCQARALFTGSFFIVKEETRGASYACGEGWGIFDMPGTDVTRAMVTAMKS